MPIYEFHCEKCKKDSEILIRSTKWQGTKCPHCGSTKLTKGLSVFASSVASSHSQAPACGMGNGGAGCGCCCAGPKHRH